MHFSRLTMSGIKGETAEHDLGKVTFVVGPNGSGKTAVMEALRLSITGSAEVGSQGGKQALIASGKAAEASIEALGHILGKWAIKVGKSASKTHFITVDGAMVKPEDVIGSMPITVDDWWALTGEERWRLVGSVTACDAVDSMLAGKILRLSDGLVTIPESRFNLSNAEAIASWTQEKIKEQRNAIDKLSVTANPPDLYMGRPSSEIGAELEGLQASIAQQKKARDGIAHREAMAKKDSSDLETLRAEIKNLEETHAKEKIRIVELKADMDKAQAAEIEYRNIEPFTPKIVVDARQAGWTTRRCLEQILGDMVDLADTAVDLATQADDPESAANLMQIVRAFEGNKLGTYPSNLDRAMPVPKQLAVVKEILAKHKCNTLPFLVSLHRACEQDLSNQASRLLSLQRSIEQIETRQQIEQVAFGPLLLEEDYARLLVRRDEVQAEMRKAQEWESWKHSSKANAEHIATARLKLEELEDASSKVRALRTEMLKNSVGVVENKANEYLNAMGLPNLRLSVTATAKTSSLTLTNTLGVDIAAMAGSERVQYGASLVSALQELSSAPCPVLFIEAAELSPQRLTRLLQAMRLRTRGNAFVAHWSASDKSVDEVAIIECGESMVLA